MSSRTSILLTTDNEHWYIDRDDSIYLEFVTDSHYVSITNNLLTVKVLKDCSLHKELILLYNKLIKLQQRSI